ncbi:hypothetical protein MRQ86_36270 [Streptomyces sp. MMS21 TC-5]|uniref:hypothetical protein n=1 Tax=Streptomyces sp. MMS21 TC-5 TaxID=2925833 RepID=UPI001F6006CF|nr:hypothetical protein [Streptomyces sp. MMS21 TC-5]MCI4085659.1 hypothetical protein [Streptomyces sp. MMS21 TC-5]
MITHATPVRRDITYHHDDHQATLPIELHRSDGTTETTALILDPTQLEVLYAQLDRAIGMREAAAGHSG